MNYIFVPRNSIYFNRQIAQAVYLFVCSQNNLCSIFMAKELRHVISYEHKWCFESIVMHLLWCKNGETKIKYECILKTNLYNVTSTWINIEFISTNESVSYFYSKTNLIFLIFEVFSWPCQYANEKSQNTIALAHFLIPSGALGLCRSAHLTF